MDRAYGGPVVLIPWQRHPFPGADRAGGTPGLRPRPTRHARGARPAPGRSARSSAPLLPRASSMIAAGTIAADVRRFLGWRCQIRFNTPSLPAQGEPPSHCFMRSAGHRHEPALRCRGSTSRRLRDANYPAGRRNLRVETLIVPTGWAPPAGHNRLTIEDLARYSAGSGAPTWRCVAGKRFGPPAITILRRCRRR